MTIMKFNTILFFLVCFELHVQCVTSWTGVQISTCDVPVINTPFKICCYTENLPSGASVFFSNHFDHLVRIGPSCDIWYNDVGRANDSAINCTTNGNVTVYSLTIRNKLIQDYADETFACGYYGNKSETTITVLNDHTTSYHLLDSSPLIGFNMYNLTHSSIKVYVLQSNVTFLDVNADNIVTYIDERILYNRTGLSKFFTVKIRKLERNLSGTFVCEYTVSNGELYRRAMTVVVLGKPKAVQIRNTTLKESNPKLSRSLTCDAISGSAAPLFIKHNLVTDWIIPSKDDWSKGKPGYNASANGTSVNISNIDCSRSNLLPIYCTVSEQSLTSDRSPGFYPNKICTKVVVSSANSSEPGDPKFRALVIGLCFSVTSAVFVFVITIVVARRHVKKKLGKCCRCFRKCCRCCADILPSSDSDSDSDLERGLERSRRDIVDEHPWRRRRRRSDEIPTLADGLRPARDTRPTSMQTALENIAIEESRQTYDLYNRQASGSNVDGVDNSSLTVSFPDDNGAGGLQSSGIQIPPDIDEESRGAVGGAPRNVVEVDDDLALLREVESLLNSHNRHLGRDVVPLQVSRENILENLIGYYTEEALAKSRITVSFVGEEGMDCGGVTYDMFTTFWYRAQEEFFIGYEAVVPYLPPQRFTDDSKYRTLGRILSHSVAVMKEFPIRICKSTIIAMIYETTDVSADVLLEDFLYFLDDHDRNLVTTAINNYSSLTSDQSDDLMTIFERYEYASRITADNFKHHVTQLARHVICIRPRPLLDKMRSGIPQSHLEHFWCNFHLKTLGVLFRALKPTPERVISRLKTSDENPNPSRRELRVFGFLKDLLKEMSEPELETFLHFVTGKKSIPREKVTIEFTTETGKLRLPKAHTCSNMMELPSSYEDYYTFRSELKNLLASDEALKMSMA